MKVLFVCLGNICRSPSAEIIFQTQVQERGLAHSADSAGTAGYHIGSLADPRTRAHALKRGYDIIHRARKFEAQDFRHFDHIICMDHQNLANVRALDPEGIYADKLHLFAKFGQTMDFQEVPDPYHGGEADFELVLDICEDASRGLIAMLESRS